jgi:hypothetical protein
MKSNGGELIIYHITDVADYDEPVWFLKKAIANIFSLKIMKKAVQGEVRFRGGILLGASQGHGAPQSFV